MGLGRAPDPHVVLWRQGWAWPQIAGDTGAVLMGHQVIPTTEQGRCFAEEPFAYNSLVVQLFQEQGLVQVQNGRRIVEIFLPALMFVPFGEVCHFQYVYLGRVTGLWDKSSKTASSTSSSARLQSCSALQVMLLQEAEGAAADSPGEQLGHSGQVKFTLEQHLPFQITD